jgi:hypothetical protein
MNQLAPIILFVYNRAWHTQQTLDALAKNELAKESILYIYADGAKENATATDLQKIEELRKVISNFNGCKEVHLVLREKNKGLSNNVTEGITKVINQHGKIIVLEDDIFVSPYFLDFMNQALDLYENEEHVYGVTGYSYYPNEKLASTFLLPLSSVWGWATWKKTWDICSFDAQFLLSEVEKQRNAKAFDFGSYPFLNLLKFQLELTSSSWDWDICFYASIFLKHGSFVFPNQSITINIGMDNSGTHCTEEVFENQELITQKYIVKKATKKESKKAEKWVRESFEKQFSENKQTKLNTFFKKIKNFIK